MPPRAPPVRRKDCTHGRGLSTRRREGRRPSLFRFTIRGKSCIIGQEKEERRVNAKSLLGVLSLGIMKDTTVTLIADGSDEKEAVDALAELIENLDE